MNNAFRLVCMLVAVAAVAVLSCWVASRFFRQRPLSSSDDSHAWIHRELGIDAKQDKGLEAIEERYAQRRRELAEVIRLGNLELAQAILEDRGYSPRVTAIVEKIHRAQGELQKATLEHVFEMRSALRPEQYEKLLRATASALQSQPG